MRVCQYYENRTGKCRDLDLTRTLCEVRGEGSEAETETADSVGA